MPLKIKQIMAQMNFKNCQHCYCEIILFQDLLFSRIIKYNDPAQAYIFFPTSSKCPFFCAEVAPSNGLWCSGARDSV